MSHCQTGLLTPPLKMAAETPTHSFWKSDQVQSLVSTLMYGVGGSLGYTIANLGLEG
jgi:hypothetical protein